MNERESVQYQYIYTAEAACSEVLGKILEFGGCSLSTHAAPAWICKLQCVMFMIELQSWAGDLYPTVNASWGMMKSSNRFCVHGPSKSAHVYGQCSTI